LKSERSAYASSFSHSAMRRQRTQFYATCDTDRILGNDNGQAVIAEWKWSGDGAKAGQWLSRG
jgi:hypothetical protein